MTRDERFAAEVMYEALCLSQCKDEMCGAGRTCLRCLGMHLWEKLILEASA